MTVECESESNASADIRLEQSAHEEVKGDSYRQIRPRHTFYLDPVLAPHLLRLKKDGHVPVTAVSPPYFFFRATLAARQP